MSVRQKWRPSLALVVAVVCVFLVTMPIIGALTARLTSNQFVRETEHSLLTQGAVMAEVYAFAFQTAAQGADIGNALTGDALTRRAETYHPLDPQLSVFRDDVWPPRPDGIAGDAPLSAPHAQIAPDMARLVKQAQKSTLAGYIVLDHRGQAIASSGDENLSYAHIDEVSAALQGTATSALRRRSDGGERHPLASISRDEAYRVFVAVPAIVENRVIGAVYLSRTPLDLRKYLYQERGSLTVIGLVMLIGASVVGLLFWRLLYGPIRGLMAQSRAVANGSKPAPEPLDHYGMKELADLGQSVLSMASTLSERGAAIETYTAHVTHEMKSPVTAIMGAAELLHCSDEPVSPERRDKLQANILSEAQRMNTLLERLRDLARAKTKDTTGDTIPLNKIGESLRSEYPSLTLTVAGDGDAALPLPATQAQAALSQLLQNAAQHSARSVVLNFDATAGTLSVQDDGSGISAGNRDKVLTPFFTTRRDSGGTGVGLSIVTAILEQNGGTLLLEPSDKGARFVLTFG
ncbi:ATP-binding protein [Actibacterium ureilyticum]|uniref:ATP-binding protein n=1 Tax=Actibacterium ureilyticum TaxID=1590614 RepID=UPI000BAACC29|nr:ATP-binding protein [Actibacterium ureilyticum]